MSRGDSNISHDSDSASSTEATPLVEMLIEQLDSLIDGPAAAARLVACGALAVRPLRGFLIDGRPRGVCQPRLWAVQALAGLGADEVLLEYLRRPIASEDAVVRFSEQTVRSAAAAALARTTVPDAVDILVRAASDEHLPGALESLAQLDPERALPILIEALGNPFMRDAAQAALHTRGAAARDALIDAALDPGAAPQATFDKRRSALEVLHDIGIDDDGWSRVEGLLDDPDPELVCATALIGVGRSRDPARIVRRLLDVLPRLGWEWLGAAEDLLVRAAVRATSQRAVLDLPPLETDRLDIQMAWRRIQRRLRGDSDRARRRE